MKPESLNEEMNRVVQLILKSNLDEAKAMISKISAQVTDERERGALAALNGLIVSITKRKDMGKPIDEEKLAHIAISIQNNQMADEFDKGYWGMLLHFLNLYRGSR